MPLASRTFFTGVVTVWLNPASGTCAAVDPSREGLGKQKRCADVVVGVADLRGFNDRRGRMCELPDGFGATFRFSYDG